MGINIPVVGIYADALFTKTQQRVPAELFGQSDRSFYANEIIALAASGAGAVQRELARLEAAALVTVHRDGNEKHYQANHAAAIFAELRSILLKTSGVTDVLRAAQQSLWSVIEAAFVDGSIAKGTGHAGSDVDLMVIGSLASNAHLLEALMPAQAQLGRAVNPAPYTSEEFPQRVRDGRSFIKRVLEQAKVFAKGTEEGVLRLGGIGESGAHRQAQGAPA